MSHNQDPTPAATGIGEPKLIGYAQELPTNAVLTEAEYQYLLANGQGKGIKAVILMDPRATLAAQRAPVVGGDALALAVRFHETYERLAPSFGYETRTDTRTFDPESKNGRLMVAVCRELLSTRPAESVAQGGEDGAVAYQTRISTGLWRECEFEEYDRMSHNHPENARKLYASPTPATGSGGEAILPAPTLKTERDVRQAIADLHREYHDRIEPLVAVLVKYDATKPRAITIPAHPAPAGGDAGDAS